MLRYAPRLLCIVHILFSGIFMKSSKLPGMLSVKSKKGLDYMDMILKTTDLCKNFKGQMAVNNVSLNIRATRFMVCWGRMGLANPRF